MIKEYDFICLDCKSFYILGSAIVDINNNDEIIEGGDGAYCGDCSEENIITRSSAKNYPELDNVDWKRNNE